MNPKTKDLWVLIETDENGAAKNVGLELLSTGRSLAKKQGGRLAAVVIAGSANEAVREAAAYGAELIYTVTGPEYRDYTTDAYSEALLYLLEKYAPLTVLIGATPNGRDLAPVVSCRLGTGLTADCTELDVDEETGDIIWTRPAFGGNLMARITCADHRPQMGTVRPGVFPKSPAEGTDAEIIEESFRMPEDAIRTKVLEVIRDLDGEKIDLENAQIIISGGRGVGGPDGFAPLREMASLLGAEVGASRAAVDAGWISHAHQVGQTGRTVAPKLYIACGISGAIQHVAGIGGAQVIVAINKDPNAPIFRTADYGIVGDLFEVLPVLTEEIRKARKQKQDLPRPEWAGAPVKARHIEMIPPKHDTLKLEADLALFAEKFRRFTEDGFIVSITDNAMARLAFQAYEVIDAMKLDCPPDQVLIHLNTFHTKAELDRILAFARENGIRNFLAVTGDGSERMHKLEPSELEAEGVPVTTSVELIRYIRKYYPEFIIGAAFNPYEPPETEFKKLERKLEAGASYVITQPIIGKDPQVDRLLRDYPGLPVIAEVWMSKRLYLLSDIFGRPIPEDAPYDPMKTRKDLEALYPGCGSYLALLGYKTQYPVIAAE